MIEPVIGVTGVVSVDVAVEPDERYQHVIEFLDR